MTQRTHLILGLVCVVLALGTAFLWIPLDTDTGLIEKVRRRVTIGDARAPTIAAGFVVVGGLSLLLFERHAADQPSISRANMGHVLRICLLLLIAFLLMRWAGPMLAGGEEYRLLRATPPWKWLGFVLGGTLLVTGLIAVIERRLSLTSLLVGLGITALLIAVFDLPFSDLLLPPNGDV